MQEELFYKYLMYSYIKLMFRALFGLLLTSSQLAANAKCPQVKTSAIMNDRH